MHILDWDVLMTDFFITFRDLSFAHGDLYLKAAKTNTTKISFHG